MKPHIIFTYIYKHIRNKQRVTSSCSCVYVSLCILEQVAGALCMWIKELSNYCKAHIDSLEMEEKLDDLQDKLSVVTDEKVCLYVS
jgi:hypothetical protein